MKEVEQVNLWPENLLYFRRMGSREISDFVENTPAEKRLVLITWGVLEAHGPWLPVANDSMMAQVATDVVAKRLQETEGIQPIIFNSFSDIGSYSATRDLPGAVAIEGWQDYSEDGHSPVFEMWDETIKKMKDHGFDKFFLINGDGGNWMNFVERPWENGFKSMLGRLSEKHGVNIDGSNWDQDGGYHWKHAGHHEHAFINWLLRFAPDFERQSALRAGLRQVPDEFFPDLDGKDFGDLDSETRRRSNWADFPIQKEVRGVTEFSMSEYLNLLYEPDGRTPRKSGGIGWDFNEKIDKLTEKVLLFLKRR